MRTRGENGFSLIEVVIALGLLAGVLIAIGGLFVMGGKSVKSGRTSSEALATGREILEEMNGWGYAQLWGNFGLAGTATTYTVDTQTCTTADCLSWQNALVSKLGPSAHATIKLDSVAQAALAVPNFSDGSGNILAKNVRVTINVLWTQVRGRNRSVSIVTNRN